MNKYKITYKNKYYFYNAVDCENAFEKFSNKKVFGNLFIITASIKQYDADTRGKNWIQYLVNNENFVLVEKL